MSLTAADPVGPRSSSGASFPPPKKKLLRAVRPKAAPAHSRGLPHPGICWTTKYEESFSERFRRKWRVWRHGPCVGPLRQLLSRKEISLCGLAGPSSSAPGPVEAGNTLSATSVVLPPSSCGVAPLGLYGGCCSITPTTPRVVRAMQMQPNTKPMGRRHSTTRQRVTLQCVRTLRRSLWIRTTCLAAHARAQC